MFSSRATSLVLLALFGYALPADDLPPNTISLSQMMRELSAQPGFTESFLQQLQGGQGKRGMVLLTPGLVDRMRELIVGKDWQGLDRFPGWTMAAITPTVGAIGKLSGESGEPLSNFLEVGPYSLTGGGTFADLRQPSNFPGFSFAEPQIDVGYGITSPDGPSPLAAEHAESQRLAYVLNRLAANGVDGVPPGSADWDEHSAVSSPQQLISTLMATGHTVIVTDTRSIANFGQFHYKGQDVMMPFFLDTQIMVPGTTRPLLVPASHAQYEWHIRGPRLNADVSFFFAIDGRAEFRTMDQQDQAWVMPRRDFHTYQGADAVEVTRLTAAIARTYLRLHAAHPALPFNGYYAFGVCQDVVAAIELKMTGKATMFPNTAKDELFTDPRDAEINALVRRLPKDRDGKPPDPDRIFATLPVADSDAELAKITIPGLGADLIAVHRAWKAGTLQRTGSAWRPWTYLLLLALTGVATLWALRRWRATARHGG